MKKLRYIVLSLLLIATFAACGNNAEPNATSAPAPVPTSFTTEASALTDLAVLKTFSISASELIDAMAESFKGSGYVNAFIAEPAVAETDETAFGKAITYTFQVCDGVQCVICEAKADEKVYSVFLVGDTSKMQADKGETFGAYAAVLINNLESNNDISAAIEAKLDIANSGFTDGTVNTAEGSEASFTYMVVGGVAMLLITAR